MELSVTLNEEMRRSEDRSQRTEGSGQRSEDRGQRAKGKKVRR